MASHDQGSKQFNHVLSKDWMDSPRFENKYIEGVNSFLDFAFTIGRPVGKEIQCPCAKCVNRYWRRRNDVYEHLICYGFVKGYRRWINHGESIIPIAVEHAMDDRKGYDDINGLKHNAFGDMPNVEKGNKGLNGDAKRFNKLVDGASLELYPGCTTGFSELSFITRLYHLKCLHDWSNTSFTSLLELLKEAMPDMNIPTCFNKAKTMVKDCGVSQYNEAPTTNDNDDDFKLLKTKDMSGKTKDHAKARYYLKKKKGIRKSLYPKNTNRVRCYGRSGMKFSLKKDKEIQEIKQNTEVFASMRKDQDSLTCKINGLTNLVKAMLPQIFPGMSAEQLQAMIEAAKQSPPDINIARNDAPTKIFLLLLDRVIFHRVYMEEEKM